MAFSYKNSHLTKTWVTTLFCALIAIGLIVTLVLVGDVNLLQQQWLIPHGGTLWHGTLTEQNKDWVWEVYGKYTNFNDEATWFARWGGESCQIINNGPFIFNPLILIPTLGILVLAICVPLIFKIFKWMEIDVLVFSITIAIVFNALVFTGLIPATIGTSWIWIIRFAIMIALAVICFFSLNALINFCISRNGQLAERAIKDISNSERDRNISNQALRDLTKEYKDKDKMTYVDIDKDNK